MNLLEQTSGRHEEATKRRPTLPDSQVFSVLVVYAEPSNKPGH